MTSTTRPMPQADPRRSSFIDPTSLVFWVMSVLIVVGAIVLLANNLEPIRDQGAGSLVALIAWVLYGAIAVGIIMWLGRDRHRSRWTILAALAWGGLAATAYAQIGNIALEDLVAKIGGAAFADTFSASISAPIVEESLKTIGIVGLALIPGARLRTPLDGLFYGVLVGAGFQVVEDFVYTLSAIGSSSDALGAVIQMLFLRGVVMGLFTHAVYSGLIGAGIGYFVSRRTLSTWRRLLPVAVAFLVAWAFHALFDFNDQLGTMLILGVIPLVLLLIALWWARRDARRLATSA